ncbi:MAG TPA: FMN-binding protein [Thermoanaerobaculia bacterium]|nr:FMN-binding protein [Thermoanaerobaculia bacterium]
MRLPETARLVLTLGIAGTLSGVTIVSTYRLTLPRIQANQAAALERAVLEVLPGGTSMQRLVWGEHGLAPAATGAEGGDSVYGGYDAAGGFVGYAIPAAGAGFQDTIRLIYGYDPGRRRIVGMEVLESRETPGLGDRIFKDPEFVAEFRDLAVEPRVALVKGHGEGPNEVDAITGATISSQAVVRILGQANEAWLPRLPPAAEAPPLPPPQERRPVHPGGERGGPVPGGRAGEGR